MEKLTGRKVDEVRAKFKRKLEDMLDEFDLYRVPNIVQAEFFGVHHQTINNWRRKMGYKLKQ